SNVRQWLPYAYVTVTYADVSSARARRRFHLAVAFLTPEGHRFGLTIRDDAHLPHDCSVMQHRVAGGLDRVVERQFAFAGRLARQDNRLWSGQQRFKSSPGSIRIVN